MNDTTRLGDIMYYTGPLSRVPAICVEPQDAGEIEMLMEISSNWMKLFNASDALSTIDLKKILYIEICGRRRKVIINRVRALIETRQRDRNIEDLNGMISEVVAERKK